MNPDEVPIVQPPDPLEIIDDEVKIEKTLNKKTTTFDTPNINLPSNETEATHDQNKNKEKHTDTDVIILKVLFYPKQTTPRHNELSKLQRQKSLWTI